MKRFFICVCLSAIAALACKQSEIDPPKPSEADFLDVNISFSHARIKPVEGTALTVSLYGDEVSGKKLSDLKPFRSEKTVLSAVQAKDGLRVTVADLERKTDHMYVLVWADVDADGTAGTGDLVKWYDASVQDVEEGKASPKDCIKEYSVTIKMNMGIAEGPTVVPEGMVADNDRNLYHTVTAGPFIWIKENLRTTHFQDGGAITISEGEQFASLSGPGCVNPFSNDEDFETFGLLYNWYAAHDGNPCPEGYRVPSDADLLAAERFFSPRSGDLGEALMDVSKTNVNRGTSEGLGTMMKAAAPLFDGTDDFGISIVAAGVYAISHTKFVSMASPTCALWTADESPSEAGRAVRRLLVAGTAGSGRGTDVKTKGQSIRCIKDNPDYVAKENLPSPVLSVNGSVVSWEAVPGAASYVVLVSSEEVTRTGNTSVDIAEFKPAQSEDKTYSVSVYCTGDESRYNDSVAATTSVTVKGSGDVSGKTFVKDYDGNSYEVVTIGDQTWMRTNLRAAHFQDGTAIPVLEGSAFASASSAACVNPFGDELAGTFGYHYNWFAAATEGKNPCPSGYHVPSDEEFVILERTLSGDETLDVGKSSDDYGVNAWRGKDKKLGTIMKSSDYGFGGDESSLFNAQAAGTYGSSLGKDYGTSTKIACFWTSTPYSGNPDKAMRRMLQHNNDGSGRGSNTKVSGHSIRCVKD